MKGPEKVRWLKYYIAQPIESICNAFSQIGEAFKGGM